MNKRTVRDRIVGLQGKKRDKMFRALTDSESETVEREFALWAHDGQRPPPDEWRTWVIMGGRGFGKTRAGAEWVRGLVDPAAPQAARGGNTPSIALVGATIDEVRRVMIEGPSGLLTVAEGLIAEWRPTLRRLSFVGGGQALLYSGASPEALRGPQHSHAWCDELAKWPRAKDTWDMLQLGLRVGPWPRAIVTTTPKAGTVLDAIMARGDTVVTGGATWANPHLPGAFIETVTGLYGGTRLGAQELEGKLVDPAGALWTRAMIEGCRLVKDSPPWPGGEHGC